MLDLILDKVNGLAFTGIGYIVKPSDLTFDEYINNCFITQTVSFLPDPGGLAVHSVPIPSYLLQLVKFPNDKENFGSIVVYLVHPINKRPIIIALLDKIGQENALEYHEFKYSSTYGNNSVNIIGRGDRGNLIISVESEEENGGNIEIIVNHLTDNGKINIEVRGNVTLLTKSLNVTVEEDTFYLSKNLSIEIEEDFAIKSKSLDVENEKTQIKSNSIELGKDSLQKAVRGESLNNDILSPLLDILSSLTVVVTGTSGVINPTIVPQITALKVKLNSILSKKIKIE